MTVVTTTVSFSAASLVGRAIETLADAIFESVEEMKPEEAQATVSLTETTRLVWALASELLSSAIEQLRRDVEAAVCVVTAEIASCRVLVAGAAEGAAEGAAARQLSEASAGSNVTLHVVRSWHPVSSSAELDSHDSHSVAELAATATANSTAFVSATLTATLLSVSADVQLVSHSDDDAALAGAFEAPEAAAELAERIATAADIPADSIHVAPPQVTRPSLLPLPPPPSSPPSPSPPSPPPASPVEEVAAAPLPAALSPVVIALIAVGGVVALLLLAAAAAAPRLLRARRARRAVPKLVSPHTMSATSGSHSRVDMFGPEAEATRRSSFFRSNGRQGKVAPAWASFRSDSPAARLVRSLSRGATAVARQLSPTRGGTRAARYTHDEVHDVEGGAPTPSPEKPPAPAMCDPRRNYRF